MRRLSAGIFNLGAGSMAMMGPGRPAVRRIGQLVGVPNLGLAADGGAAAYNQFQARDEATRMADQWSRGQPPDYAAMVEDLFRPRPPMSR